MSELKVAFSHIYSESSESPMTASGSKSLRIMRAGTTGSSMVRRLTSRPMVRIQTVNRATPSPAQELRQKSNVFGIARFGSVKEEQDQANSDADFLNAVPAGLELPSPVGGARVSESRCSDGLHRCYAGLFHRKPVAAPAASGTGILVHGCHLLADGWEHIVWGNPPHELGRVPHAVLLAWEEKARVVVFGTGASERDGKKESEVTMQYMYDHWAELARFDALKHVPLDEARKLMQRIAVADTETQNTDQEVRNGLQVMAQKRCSHALLVSSPTHLPRCLACACKVIGAEPELFTGPMYASPSDTCYEGASASDVVVVEPPHRGDRDKELDSLGFHDLVKRTFRVKPIQKAEFLREFTGLLEKYGV